MVNKELIIQMAREAGFCHDINNGIYICAPMHIERFAALVAAAEREACAKVCEDLDAWNLDDPGSTAAAAIRARGQSK